MKLLLPNTENDLGKSKVRTYTVRSIDHTKEEITIDFALHSPAGPATDWALNA
ncbi:MAG: siderophore-interacting protein [Cytophagales bacterium]|nr:siderophore-interacting protein [Cytophagales bacterium]